MKEYSFLILVLCAAGFVTSCVTTTDDKAKTHLEMGMGANCQASEVTKEAKDIMDETLTRNYWFSYGHEICHEKSDGYEQYFAYKTKMRCGTAEKAQWDEKPTKSTESILKDVDFEETVKCQFEGFNFTYNPESRTANVKRPNGKALDLKCMPAGGAKRPKPGPCPVQMRKNPMDSLPGS